METIEENGIQIYKAAVWCFAFLDYLFFIQKLFQRKIFLVQHWLNLNRWNIGQEIIFLFIPGFYYNIWISSLDQILNKPWPKGV